ncbi:hypothetical protein [Serratia proteamaculans]|nr:hypothetical protein [Serratia proteamaculans]CAI1232673.1 Uncharacterised protein [Serratia proteamaculans]
MFAQNVKRTKRKQFELGGMESYGKLNEAVFDSKPVEFRYLLPQSTYSMDYKQFIEWLSSYSQPDYPDSIRRIRGFEHIDKLYAELGVDAKLLEAPRFS